MKRMREVFWVKWRFRTQNIREWSEWEMSSKSSELSGLKRIWGWSEWEIGSESSEHSGLRRIWEWSEWEMSSKSSEDLGPRIIEREANER